MTYESAGEAAKRLGVTTRTIQKWAKEGKFKGAYKHGRDWMIPTGDKSSEEKDKKLPMLLLNSAFPRGKCREYIQSIEDKDMRALAEAEYYYFTGQAEKASEIVEMYVNSEDIVIAVTAGFLYIFANISRGHTHLTHFAGNILAENVAKVYRMEEADDLKAVCTLFSYTTASLLHLPVSIENKLEEEICNMSEGIRVFAFYALAYQSYLAQDYQYSLGMVDAALWIEKEIYPIAVIYLNLLAAIDLMNLKRVSEAKARFQKAWHLAKADDIIEPFGELHGGLQGLIEVNFRKDYPRDFERIINITQNFNIGWKKIYNKVTRHEVDDNLTTMEFTIATLYNRGWSIKEIAAYMQLSVRTISNYLQVIYGKLHIKGKKELENYMLL